MNRAWKNKRKMLSYSGWPLNEQQNMGFLWHNLKWHNLNVSGSVGTTPHAQCKILWRATKWREVGCMQVPGNAQRTSFPKRKNPSWLKSLLLLLQVEWWTGIKAKTALWLSALEGAGATLVGVGSRHSSLVHHQDLTVLHRGLNCWWITHHQGVSYSVSKWLCLIHVAL